MKNVVRTKFTNNLWTLALTLGLFYLTTVFGNQNIASPVFQNHKTKEWTSLDNITFEFDCTKRSVGFYADMDYNCQIFHMCDEEGNRIPHLCANETSFNQEYRICDWDYNFNCTESPKWFYLNELTYATESPEDEDY